MTHNNQILVNYTEDGADDDDNHMLENHPQGRC